MITHDMALARIASRVVQIRDGEIDFADAVADAGLTFIGPPGDVHRTMGDKRACLLMAAAGVPVLPGYDGDDQTDDGAGPEARIGWPLMIKPSRGGGGKGMRVVRGEKEFLPALAGSRREARSAFGDDVLVLEKFVERPRHIEVQVLADAMGHVVHLLERECSIQRRHQKVVEETPSPALTGRGGAAVRGGSRRRASGRLRERGHRRVPALARRAPSTSSR